MGNNVVVGVDVGGTRKGYHSVALRAGRVLESFQSSDAIEIVDRCRSLGALAVGVDAPCRWSRTGRARCAERKLMQRGISCFSTPTREVAEAHPTDHFGWMRKGAELFDLLEGQFSLYRGGAVLPGVQHCFETFPQAVACALAGQVVSAKQKSSIRRALLEREGIETATLRNIDWVDAALCAVTAERFLAGKFATYGEPETGFILVPQR